MNKYRHFNNYGFSGPNNGFLYPASGATDDWAYGALGAAGMTFELGTEFYESCEYFESSIVGINIKALTYAAKTSMAPYSLSKGPDVTSMSANVNGNSLTVAVSASDSAFSSANHPTSRQGVAEIRVFVDEYPTSGVSGGTVVSGSSLTVDISSIAQGRHMVYVQATDGAGYKGPVTSAFFTKEGNDGTTPAPVPVVTPSPVQPTPVATPVPVQQPTPVPVQQPTASPVGSPPSCQDQQNWHDSDGAEFDCEWYSQGNNCQEYGNDFGNFGATATGACCVCGGGSPGGGGGGGGGTGGGGGGGGGGGTTCQDQLNWHDSDGSVYDCDWYAEGNNCATYGNAFSNFGATANQACCVCQI